MLHISKESKQGTYTLLLITFLIFNQFSIWKSFVKLCLKAFQPYHQILCMSKHVQCVKAQNSLLSPLDTFDMNSITALTVYFELLLTPLTYIALQPFQCILSFFWQLWHYCNSIVVFTTYWKFWCCNIHCLFGVNECQWFVYTHTFPFIPNMIFQNIYYVSTDSMHHSWIQGW